MHGKGRKIIKGLLLFAVAGFMLVFGGWKGIHEESGGLAAWAAEEKSDPTEIGPMLKLSPVVVNLNGAGGRHYLKTRIVLEIGRQEWVGEVEKRIPFLTDMIIVTLGDKRLEDVRQPQGREELKKEILAKAHKTLPPSKIRKIYFDEFLFQ